MYKKIEIIKDDIYIDANFSTDTIYVIIGEVRILQKVNLYIEKNTEIYLTNGSFINKIGMLVKTKLIFEPGSKLFGHSIFFKACDENYIPIFEANNGGVFFLGTSSKANKDFISSDFNTIESSFNAEFISLSYLGGKDKLNTTTKDYLDDYDAISILGVGNNEWKINNIYSEYSGDDGFDVENSSITLDNVVVINAYEDGINITSSRVNIIKSLIVDATINDIFDRDIFDLETDNGPSYIRLAHHCYVKINGIFGDQLTLISDDLPQPLLNKSYLYDNELLNGQTYIYSGNFNL